jgi:hypothetical protein
LIAFARTLLRAGEPERALAAATAALTIARERGFVLKEARALTMMAHADVLLDRSPNAVDLCGEALRLHVQTAHPMGEAETLTILGDAEWIRGRPAAARAAWERSRTRLR